MFQGNYEKLLEKISEMSGESKEELNRKVEAKRAKLAGLISNEGAAQVVAAELGISFDNQKLKLNELVSGMKKVNTVAKVVNLYPVRTFTAKSGSESKVTNLFVADETSNTKVVLWDTNHISLIENGDIKEGDTIEIGNANIRDEEIHLGSFSEFKKSNEELGEVKTEKVVKEKNISNLKIGDNANLRAFIVQSFEPKFFYVCPQCKKKANQGAEGYNCNEHGKVVPEKRALMNIFLDDGTENIRALIFSENFSSLGINDLENQEMLSQQRENLKGKEFYFKGNVRKNNYFNNEEFIIDEIKEINLDNLVQVLEKSEQ